MSIASGTRLGPYEVIAPLGAGGMGEVYRAKDTRLDRNVAIKILPAELSQNAQLRIRFEREAKAISSLTHPNICTLHDVGQHDGVEYLVMELLEGETLADRLIKGPLPIDQVLRYGIEIAAALDRAHKAGVMHRDLKPGNIMITRSGAKLLDFGLAKSTAAALTTDGPTALKSLTAEGSIVGTFQYMAPEQLEGAEADARTDIFAFGAVLYEMTSGERAFQGKTRTSLIAAIVSGEPAPLSQIQPLTPATLERVVRKCLAKDPEERWQCAADLKWELQRLQQEPALAPQPTARSWLAWAVAAAAILLSAILALTLRRPNPSPRPIRFSVAPPTGWVVSLNYSLGPPALSPDGKYLAFAASDLTGRVLLWLRDLSATEPVALAGTDGAGFVFWSPDSKSLGFFAGGYLKRTDLDGGSPQVLCPASFGRGASWSQHNEIIFTQVANGPLYRVSANGGTPQQLTRMDASRKETSHRLPYFLPDGKHFLFTIRTPSTAESGGDSIYIASVDSPVPRQLLNVSSNVAYAEPGYLLFLRNRTLVAQRFNTRKLRLEGEPRAVTRNLMQFHPSGFGLFTVSRSGVLAFATGSLLCRLDRLDRGGQPEPAVAGTGDYHYPRLSPDQQHILYALPDAISGMMDLWLYDVARRVSRRLTFHQRDDFSGVLTPDGTQMIYSSNRSGYPNLYLKAVDGSDEKHLLSSPTPDFAESISSDGRLLLFRRVSGNFQNDVWVLPLSGGSATPLLASPFNEIQPVFSPTQRWVAYASNESGRYEVYAARYPSGGSRVQISVDGGTQPTWRGDEKELFYVAPGNRIMSVPIDASGASLKPGTAAQIAEVYLRPSRNEERQYDVSRDGRRFIMSSLDPDKSSLPIIVVLNWQTALEGLP